MTARTARAARAARAARLVEDGARAALATSRRRVHDIDAAIDRGHETSRSVHAGELTPLLRRHLVVAGARHRQHLEGQRAELQRLADIDHERWAQARLRVRSLDKLVERLGAADTARQRQADHATWQDLLAARASAPDTGLLP